MTSMQAPICVDCANDVDLDKQTCKAFPNGIPEKVWNTESLHLEPIAGDNDIVFVADKEIEPYDLNMFWEGHPDLEGYKGKYLKKSDSDDQLGFTSDTEKPEFADGDVLIFKQVDRIKGTSHPYGD